MREQDGNVVAVTKAGKHLTGGKLLSLDKAKASWQTYMAAVSRLGDFQLYNLLNSGELASHSVMAAAKLLKKQFSKSRQERRDLTEGVLLRAMFLVAFELGETGAIDEDKREIVFASELGWRQDYHGSLKTKMDNAVEADRDIIANHWKRAPGHAEWTRHRSNFVSHLNDRIERHGLTQAEKDAALGVWDAVPDGQFPTPGAIWNLLKHSCWTGQSAMHSTFALYNTTLNKVWAARLDADFHRAVCMALQSEDPISKQDGDDEDEKKDDSLEQDNLVIKGFWSGGRQRKRGLGSRPSKKVMDTIASLLLQGTNQEELVKTAKKKLSTMHWNIGGFSAWLVAVAKEASMAQTVLHRALAADKKSLEQPDCGEQKHAHRVDALYGILGEKTLDAFVVTLIRRGVEYWAQHSRNYFQLSEKLKDPVTGGLVRRTLKDISVEVQAVDVMNTVLRGFDNQEMSAKDRIHVKWKGSPLDDGDSSSRKKPKEKALVADETGGSGVVVVKGGYVTSEGWNYLHERWGGKSGRVCMDFTQGHECMYENCRFTHDDDAKDYVMELNSGKPLKSRKKKGKSRVNKKSKRRSDGRGGGGGRNKSPRGKKPRPSTPISKDEKKRRKTIECGYHKRGHCLKGDQCDFSHAGGDEGWGKKLTMREVAAMMDERDRRSSNGGARTPPRRTGGTNDGEDNAFTPTRKQMEAYFVQQLLKSGNINVGGTG